VKQVADQVRGGWALAAGAALVAALAIACCGGSSDATGQGTTASIATISDATITKAKLIKRGDAICVKTDKRQQAGLVAFEKEHPGTVKSPAGLEAVILQAALPPIHGEIKELAALGAPKGDRAKMSAIIEGLEKALRIAERKPKSILESEGPFKAPAELAANYGFEYCAAPV